MRVERQLTLILENRPGVLAEVCADLAKAKINIKGIYVENLVDHFAVRMVVDDPDKAIHLLGDSGVLVFENDIVAVTGTDKPGTLAAIARRLGAARVNIDYMYASAPQSGKATIYLCVNNVKRAQEAFKRSR